MKDVVRVCEPSYSTGRLDQEGITVVVSIRLLLALTCVVAVIMIKTRDDDDDDDDNTLCAWRHNMAPPPESLTIISAVNMKTVRLQFTAEFAKTQTTRKNRHCAILPSLCRHCQSKVQQNMGAGYAFLSIKQVCL